VPRLPRLSPPLRRARRILIVAAIITAQIHAATTVGTWAYITGIGSCTACGFVFATWWYDLGYKHNTTRKAPHQ
jgi:hypothetical protein